jgi:hypothetical protein
MQRTRIKPTNTKRRRKAFARNYGERGDAVRLMTCLCADMDWPHPDVDACSGPVQAAHAIARGMGGAKGDRRQLVPLCALHHEEAGEGSRKAEQPSKRAAFEARYGLDVQAEAERIAVELDARGLA